MLKRITLENFFSFGEPTTIELNPGVNLLVGINGSGKSNFLKAIRLLHEAVVGKGFEKTFLQEWGGFGNVASVSGGSKDYIKLSYVFDDSIYRNLVYSDTKYKPIEVVYEITIFSVGNNGYYLNEYLTPIYRDKYLRKNVNNDIINIKNGKGRIVGFNKDIGDICTLLDYPSKYFTQVYDTSELFLKQMDKSIMSIALLWNRIKNISYYGQFDTSIQSPIRQPSTFGTEEKLLPTGENLNSVIQKLKNNHSLDYEKIEDLLRDINPNFKDITFNLFGSKSYLLLREKNLSRAIPIDHISDGTLRYLLLLAIFYNPNRGQGICIDEPETGLHPDMINTIAAAIKHAAKETQFFIATHSPLLLNAFELNDVLIFEKDKKNQTKVAYKSEDDFEDWDENSLVGQLWLNGQLGGKRW